jgi:acetoin utilization protein AcuB
MRVRELMSKEIVTIDVSASCHQAVARMFQHKVRHLPVTGSDGQLVGIVTDRELRHHLFAVGAFEDRDRDFDILLRSASVNNIMSSPVISVAPDEPIEVAARLMVKDKIGALPVMEGRRPIGIITETDLLRHICQAQMCTPDVEYIVVSYPASLPGANLGSLSAASAQAGRSTTGRAMMKRVP